jgi:hypothetical protein
MVFEGTYGRGLHLGHDRSVRPGHIPTPAWDSTLTQETFQDHPIHLVSELGARSPVLTLSFSQYFYRPQSPFDERRVFEQLAAGITTEWLQDQLEELPEGWDVALNSTVRDGRSRAHHIPMIDFSKPSVGRDDLILMRSILGTSLCRSLVFYNSGRSLHAYSLHLLEPKAWREFMGRLLLLNLPNAEQLVDTRWVGHRLVSGYCALRWSSNSEHYLQMPVRAGIDMLSNERNLPSNSDDATRAPASRL